MVFPIETPTFLLSKLKERPAVSLSPWSADLRMLDTEEIKSFTLHVDFTPFVARLIGAVRREFLDHTLFLNQADLQCKFNTFK